MFKFKKEIAIAVGDWGMVEELMNEFERIGLKYENAPRYGHHWLYWTLTYWGNKSDENHMENFKKEVEALREVA